MSKLRVLFDAGGLWQFVPDRFRSIMEQYFDCNFLDLREIGDGVRKMLGKWADVIFVDWALDWAKFYLSAFPKKRIIVRTHRCDVWHENSPFYFWENADAILFMNSIWKNEFLYQSRGYILEDSDSIARRCIVVPRLVDEERFRFRSDIVQAESSKREFGKKIGMCGRIIPRKGIPEIARLMRDELRDCSLSLLGYEEKDQERFSDYKEIMELRLPNIEILPHARGDAVVKWYSSMDFIVSNSESESWHASITEGMLCECVPVIRRWTGAEEMHPESVCFATVDEMVSHIKKIAALPVGERRKIASGFRRWCTRRYALADVAGVYAAIIRGDEVPHCIPKEMVRRWNCERV
jgi:hypothetical protein